jgi:hypothetical protein
MNGYYLDNEYYWTNIQQSVSAENMKIANSKYEFL